MVIFFTLCLILVVIFSKILSYLNGHIFEILSYPNGHIFETKELSQWID